MCINYERYKSYREEFPELFDIVEEVSEATWGYYVLEALRTLDSGDNDWMKAATVFYQLEFDSISLAIDELFDELPTSSEWDLPRSYIEEFLSYDAPGNGQKKFFDRIQKLARELFDKFIPDLTREELTTVVEKAAVQAEEQVPTAA